MGRVLHFFAKHEKKVQITAPDQQGYVASETFKPSPIELPLISILGELALRIFLFEKSNCLLPLMSSYIIYCTACSFILFVIVRALK